MIRKKVQLPSLLLLSVCLAVTASAQNVTPAPAEAPSRQAAPAGSSNVSARPQSGPAPATVPPAPAGDEANCINGNCDLQPQHISIATPAPAPRPWTWQERVSWGANLLLVVFAYIGIMMGLSVLRRLERQTQASEDAAEAAASNARAVLDHVQAMARAERPWILMSVRPARDLEEGFAVVATNRGRSPARLLSLAKEIVIAVDEAHLPAVPEYKNAPVAPAEPVVLLPGETTEIASFSRMDVRRACETPEQLERVERWAEKIFLYGNVVYSDLAAPEPQPAHESGWFCWYVHGRQKSGMVMAGPTPYNRHS